MFTFRYRQKSLQDEIDKNHDDLWEEQIARAKERALEQKRSNSSSSPNSGKKDIPGGEPETIVLDDDCNNNNDINMNNNNNSSSNERSTGSDDSGSRKSAALALTALHAGGFKQVGHHCFIGLIQRVSESIKCCQHMWFSKTAASRVRVSEYSDFLEPEYLLHVPRQCVNFFLGWGLVNLASRVSFNINVYTRNSQECAKSTPASVVPLMSALQVMRPPPQPPLPAQNHKVRHAFEFPAKKISRETSLLSALIGVAVAGESAAVRDNHAAPDDGRGGAPAAARGLPAQLLAAAPATEHRQGSHNLFTLTLILSCQLIVP